MPERTNDAQKTSRTLKKQALLNSLAMMLFAGLVIFLGTISWFTMSNEVEGTGARMTAEEQLFYIEPMASPYHAGVYDDPAESTYIRNTLLSGAAKDPGTVTWTITEDTIVSDPNTGRSSVVKGKNIGNGPAQGYSAGIGPGSSGELQFKFVPNGAVRAELTFDFYAYSIEYDDQGQELPDTISLIQASASEECKSARDLLNGHILLFRDYNEQTKKYSGLISSPEDDFRRIMSETYSSETTVHIYWVWVETIAEMVLDDTNADHRKNLKGKKSLCSSQDEVLNLLKDKPEWFLLDPDTADKTWTEFTSSTSNADIVDTINRNYSLYSAYYNEADQCIGTNIAYLLLDMTANGAVAASP